MSKIRKKPVEQATTIISKKDIILEKTIQYSAWFFIISLAGFLGFWGFFDLLLKVIDLEVDAPFFSFVIFAGTSSTLGFALSSVIKKNREKKKGIFIDWMIAQFLFCMFAIFAIAVYQW
ncbi:MAG: hypothetical protein ACFFAN_01165 [Promethearchaeota archaeon]